MARTNRAYDQFPSTSGGVGTIAITLTAGRLVHVKMMGSADFGADTATSAIGNTYVKYKKEEISGFGDTVVGFYCWNCNGGAEVITLSGPFSYVVYDVEEYDGIDTSADPFRVTSGAQGATSPLTSPLVTSDTCLILGSWFNKDVDDMTGLSNLSSIYHETTGGQQYSGAGESFGVAAGTINPGFTISGDADNVAIFAAFKEAASGSDVNVTPDVGAVTITGFAPTVVATDNKNIQPGLGQITIDGFAPTVNTTDNKNVSPGLGQVIITGFEPIVSVTDSKNVAPDTGSLIVTGFAPTVEVSGDVNIEPGLGEVVVTGFDPVVSVGGAAFITADKGEVTVTGFAPTVTITAPSFSVFQIKMWNGVAWVDLTL